LIHFARYEAVARIALDHPPVNALSHELLKELSGFFDSIEKNPTIQAVVITGMTRIFSCGGDIHELQLAAASASPAEMEFMRTLLLRIEDSPIPVIAAISGQALGGGLELAMACHYRIANHSARFGLPEVTLGIIPGAGGALRLPRLAGASKAIEMCVEGKSINAADALEIGLIDKITEDLPTGTIAFARNIIGAPYFKTRERTAKLGTPTENAHAFAAAREKIHLQQNSLLAPALAIDVIEAACSLSFEDAWVVEGNKSAECMANPQAGALIHLFIAERAATKISGISADTPKTPVNNALIVGAGAMGGSVATMLANAGIHVLLSDINKTLLDCGIETIRKNYESLISAGSITQQTMNERMELIKPTLDWNEFEHADIAIEAANEDLDVKREIFARLDEICKPSAILASTTSTLSINKIAEATSRPQSVIGAHFFISPPAERLVEIARGTATSAQVIAAAMQLMSRLGKLGVVVKDRRNFAANRIAERYRTQASYLVKEGASIEEVDRALIEFGMAGTSLLSLPEVRQDVERREIGKEEIIERCIYMLINEAARILDEGVVQRASDIDVICVAASGFPAWLGGPLWYADTVGLRRIYDRICEFQRVHGKAWEPAPLLQKLALSSGSFYSIAAAE
jgi:3-hydroxyacyl-CoA dehydrogenase